MEQTNLKITTWGCVCEYSQDFDPGDALKWEQYITNDTQLQRVAIAKGRILSPQGKCPACWLGLNDERVIYDRDLYGITDFSNLATTTSASDADLESRQLEMRDADGRVIQEQTGERYELRVNQQTGQIYSEAVPVYEPKMVPISQQQLAALKEQRDRSLDALESVAVKEVTQTKEELK